MKHTKTFAALLSAAVLALTALAFAACGGRSGDDGAIVKESGEKLLVIEATETGGSLEDGLITLLAAGKVTYDDNQTEFGLSMTTINGYTVDASKNEYWAQYTSLSVMDGVTYSSTEYGSYTYGDLVLGYSNYGPTYMPLVKGEIYVFVVQTY